MKSYHRPSFVLLVAGALCLGAFPEAGASSLPATLDLPAALALAVEHNPAIRQSRARIDESSGALDEARAGRLPTVTVSAGYTRTDEGRFENLNGIRFGNPDAWTAGVQAVQPLYTGGAVEAGTRGARASREAALADYETTVHDELLAVRERFFDVLLARERVVVAEEAVKLLEEELENARARVDAGSGSPFERLRAEVALANGQPPLIRARNGLRLAAVDLVRAIGLPPDDSAGERVTGRLEFSEAEVSKEAALASALERRPELRRLERLVEAAGEAVTAAGAGTRPSLGVFAGYDVAKSSFSDDFGDSVDGWSAGIQGSWSIFDGKATRGKVAQVRSRLEQSRIALESARLAIEAEVRRAHSSHVEAGELMRASQKVVEQAEESVRLARARFDAGAATQLDVLQSQVALTEARTNEAEALHGAGVALARLQRAAALIPLPAEAEAGR